MRATLPSVGGVVLALLFTACANEADPTTTSLATTTETQPEQSRTTTTIATPTTTAAARISLPAPGEPWDVIFLSEVDYPVTELGAEFYIQHAEAALGVELRLADTGPLIPWAWELNRQIEGDSYPGLADAIAESEIIIVQPLPERSLDGDPGQIGVDSDTCQWETDRENPQPPENTLPAYWLPYRLLLDQIYEQIWTLRQDAPTLLIAMDVHHSMVHRHTQVGIADECRDWYETWGEVMRESAESHGARWVSIYDVFNGPDHDLDPIALGYIGPSDELPTTPFYAPNELGSRMVADAIASAGFDPVITTPMSVSWDGEVCTVEGPAHVVPGRVTLDIVNASEADELRVGVGQLLGDHTVQDLIDEMSPEPDTGHAPGWLREMGPWRHPAAAGETASWLGVLAPGTYATTCVRINDFGVWFGAGFTVGDQ